jgi:hypothetical protein
MSQENPLWGASRIHGELLMLGFKVAQSTVSKYLMRGRRPPSQSWKTFLRNHADAIAAIDMCVVSTVTFERLFAFLVLGHSRRQLLWFEVIRHPTAEWLARHEAFPWESAPSYLVVANALADPHSLAKAVYMRANYHAAVPLKSVCAAPEMMVPVIVGMICSDIDAETLGACYPSSSHNSERRYHSDAFHVVPPWPSLRSR